MKIQESTRRYIVGGLTLLVVVGLIVANVMGKKQDTAFQADEAQFYQGAAELQEGQYAEALVTLEGVEKRHRSSEVMNYAIGLAAINTGDAEKAALHYQRALDINPYKVEDAMFMLQYAEVLIFAEKKDEAGQVLEHCATFVTPEEFPEYPERVAELQVQLADNLEKDGSTE